jgi:hypothetical protein
LPSDHYILPLIVASELLIFAGTFGVAAVASFTTDKSVSAMAPTPSIASPSRQNNGIARYRLMHIGHP